MFAKDRYIYTFIDKMFSWLKHIKVIYILSNLLVLPAIIIPNIEFLSNLSFIISFFLLINTNLLLFLAVCVVFSIKNNSNYRFNLLLKHKGVELSKSDHECVYLFAWCTLLRYFLIGICVNQIYLYFI